LISDPGQNEFKRERSETVSILNADLSAELPAYSVRRSARAKHVNLKVCPTDGVVVIIPKGFNEGRIPALLAENHAWLTSKLSQLPDQTLADDLPEHVEFKALNEIWTVSMQPANAPTVTVRSSRQGKLNLHGNITNTDACHQALHRWLARRGRAGLAPWLQQISQRFALPFNKLSVRGQKTRWGSCSSGHNISLNYKLLFLEPRLVDAVLIHELCHTVHMNHGPAFRTLLDRLQPDHRATDHALNRAWRELPAWVNRRPLADKANQSSLCPHVKHR
jgi:predicted metal-dependent hydrolase